MTLSENINSSKDTSPNSFDKMLKVAVLSSFTLNGLAESLRANCKEIKIDCSSYVCGYNQYAQDILNPESNLYKFKPDVTFLILDNRNILGNLFYNPYSVTSEERKKLIDTKVSELINLIEKFKDNSNSKLIISNFTIPSYTPYGIYESKLDFSFQDMIITLNQKLTKHLVEDSSVYVYDFNSFTLKHGEKNVFDYRQYFIGDIKIALKYIPQLSHELMAYIKPVIGMNRKCIVLDLDNTLWGGIVGEDGFEGIQLGLKSPGNAFIEFQRYLLSLHKRGIILAVNSKNNENDALKVIREHPDMVLREENFACLKINWNDKVSNMKEIASEINIGLDSLVFFDDDPFNRELMKRALPQVETVDMPKDPAFYASKLMELTDFNVLKITDEDFKRGQMYHQQRERTELSKSTDSLEDFLTELDIRVNIKKADKFTIPRISQLTLKTNQFNLTTHRYQEEEIKKFAENDKMMVHCVEVEDKFGNNGITGAFIIKKNSSEEWLIDTFLLSCRVMGRGIENAIMSHILNDAKRNNIGKVVANYIPTKKNIPCESFLDDLGFKKEAENWVYGTKNEIKSPKHIVLK